MFQHVKLLFHRRRDPGMVVPENRHPPRADSVEIAPAGRIVQINAMPALDHPRRECFKVLRAGKREPEMIKGGFSRVHRKSF